MKKQLVYDLPTRLFHWIFAAGFIGAFLIAKAFDDESSAYPYHMLIGMTLALMVVLRVFWGFVGGRYAKFKTFPLNPSELLSYARNIMSPGARRFLGHNPASAWAALLMFLLTLGLVCTGLQMVNGNNKEFFEEVHEVFAHLFLFVVIAHVAGVVFHTLRHRDPIGLSMVSGYKNEVQGQPEAESSSMLVGVVFLVLIFGFAAFLLRSYESTTQTLKLPGITLLLGETETENEKGELPSSESEKNDDDDDDEHP